jgi:hypothetical protein
LFVVGKVQNRPYATPENQQLEFKITRIEPLFDVRERLGRFIDVVIDYKDVNEGLINRLMEAIVGQPGKTQLRVNMKTEEGFLKMPSGLFNRLSITNEVLTKLNAIDEIEYALFEN